MWFGDCFATLRRFVIRNGKTSVTLTIQTQGRSHCAVTDGVGLHGQRRRVSCPGGDRRIPPRPGGHRDHLALSVAGSNACPGDQCAKNPRAEYRRSILLTALDRGAEKAAESARRTLSRRWPDVEIEVAGQDTR